MRPSFSTVPLLFFLLFSFLVLASSLGSAAATSTPPSAAPSPSPFGFLPAHNVEKACHLMVEDNETWLVLYPYCVAALRSDLKSRKATIHKLAVLAAEILQRDALVELRRMQVMESQGIGGDPQQLHECLSNFAMFVSVFQGSIEDLRKDGRVGFQFFFVEIRDYVDCRWLQQNPVEKQMEILSLVQVLYAICNKYCKYPAPKPCRFV